MPDILDAAQANAQKAIDDAAKSAGVAPSSPPPAGDNPIPAAVTAPNPTPALPTEPTPAALPENPPSELPAGATPPPAPSESVHQAPPTPSDQPEPTLQAPIVSEAPLQEPEATDQKNDQVVDEILSAPADTAPVNPPPPQEHSPKKKGRVKGIVLAILAVFLFTIPVAVYYVSQQNRQVAELRSGAYGGCDGCRLGTSKPCGQGGTQYCVNSENCINQPNMGNWGGCVASTPTPRPSMCGDGTCSPGETATSCPADCLAPVHSPCKYCSGTNGTCTRSALSNCDNSLNECQTVGSTNECGNFVPTGCTEDGEVPTDRKPCCHGLNLVNGRCRVGGATPTPPGGGGGPDCGGATAGQPCTTGKDCHCQGGDACTSKICEPDIHTSCINQNRAWCTNFNDPSGWTCCVKGYVCASNKGCVPGPTGGGGGETPACNGVKVYKDGAVVADLGSLHVNDHIVIAVSGGLATKAHIRVNGGAWTETSTKNANNEYTLDFTILPESIVNNKVTVEAEIWGTDNAWH